MEYNFLVIGVISLITGKIVPILVRAKEKIMNTILPVIREINSYY
jgi:hypothetical protein